MEVDTKLCPFCAEEIKAAAIVCKYCGRDLPVSEASSMIAPPMSPWEAAQPFGKVILGLSLAVGLLYRLPLFELGADALLLSLVGLIIPSTISYFFSTATAALVIWAWRKFQYNLIGFILIIVLAVLLLWNFRPNFSFQSQTTVINLVNTSIASSIGSTPTATTVSPAQHPLLDTSGIAISGTRVPITNNQTYRLPDYSEMYAVPPTAEPSAGYIFWNQASSYRGQIKVVCGPVVESNYASSISDSPSFLTLGGTAPQPNRFTIVIWGEDRSNFSFAPESYYLGKNICAVGEVRFYQGSLGMDVSSPLQIAVDD